MTMSPTHTPAHNTLSVSILTSLGTGVTAFLVLQSMLSGRLGVLTGSGGWEGGEIGEGGEGGEGGDGE